MALSACHFGSSQDEEAALISAAFQAEGEYSHDIVNVGGGSIQMVLGASGIPQTWLLEFGIVDLNRDSICSVSPKPGT